jgi:hypothetical protein
MISNSRIEALIELAETEDVEGDVEPVLRRALTVGDLIKALQQYDPETPVELDIPVEFDGTEEMTSEVGFVVDVFESPGENRESDVITIRACKPDLLEDYELWESDEDNIEA